MLLPTSGVTLTSKIKRVVSGLGGTGAATVTVPHGAGSLLELHHLLQPVEQTARINKLAIAVLFKINNIQSSFFVRQFFKATRCTLSDVVHLVVVTRNQVKVSSSC